MIINKTVENGKVTLTPEGRLDTTTAPEAESIVKEVLPAATELVFDLEKLEYISSAGLRVLLASQKAMSTRGAMKVIHVNETIMEIFDVTGFSEILAIE